MFALDASGSIGSRNFRQMTEDVLNILQTFNLDTYNSYDPSRVRVGILTFASQTRVVNRLDQFYLPSAQGFSYNGGGTRTDLAIK